MSGRIGVDGRLVQDALAQVRLDAVADVRVRPTPNAIVRERGTRRMDVTAGVTGSDLLLRAASARTRCM